MKKVFCDIVGCEEESAWQGRHPEGWREEVNDIGPMDLCRAHSRKWDEAKAEFLRTQRMTRRRRTKGES